MQGLHRDAESSIWHEVKEEQHRGIIDGCGVEVELVVQNDVEAIAGIVANDIQEARVDTVIGQVGIALAISIASGGSNLRHTRDVHGVCNDMKATQHQLPVSA